MPSNVPDSTDRSPLSTTPQSPWNPPPPNVRPVPPMGLGLQVVGDYKGGGGYLLYLPSALLPPIDPCDQHKNCHCIGFCQHNAQTSASASPPAYITIQNQPLPYQASNQKPGRGWTAPGWTPGSRGRPDVLPHTW